MRVTRFKFLERMNNYFDIGIPISRLVEMCKANNKLYGNYIQNDQTKEYLNKLKNDIGIPISKLVDIKRGGNKYKQGT